MFRQNDKAIAIDGYSTRVVGLPRLTEPPAPLSICRFPQNALGRDRLESFVRAVFHHAYGARITGFYPDLLSIFKPDADIAAVAGVRAAACSTLFAEIYLDTPIEAVVSACAGQCVSRTGISEVGNLAPAGLGQARWLIAAVTAYLYSAGFSWVVFTAVPALYNAFSRMGLPLTVLTAADSSRLDPMSRADWGCYYEAGPMVCVGDIGKGYQYISTLIEPGMPRLWSLWSDARRVGAEQSSLPLAL